MLETTAWLLGAMGSIAFLLYGAFLVWQFQSGASKASQHTVASLALNDTLPRRGLLEEMKAAALAF